MTHREVKDYQQRLAATDQVWATLAVERDTLQARIAELEATVVALSEAVVQFIDAYRAAGKEE